MKTIKLSAFTMLFAMFTTGFVNAQCPVPTGLGVTTLSPTSSQLNWAAVSGASSYNVEVQDGQNNPVPFLVQGNSTTNNFTVTGLTTGSTYKFKVRTRCGGNKSNWAAYFSFIAGGGPLNCVNVTDLTVSATTATGATFNWTASAGGLGYTVRVEDASGNPVNFLFKISVPNSTYTISGLNPSSNYKVKVRKVCAIGVNSDWTPWVFFTTAGSGLRISTESEGTLNLNDEKMNIYPNPARDFIKANFNGLENEKLKSYQVLDMTGKLIQSENISEDKNNFIVPVSGLNKGIYLLNVQTTDQVFSRKIFITE